jgi:ribonuclease BN (tRNA processing enzyme)
MLLTILGSSAAYPRAGGACSGYLIAEGNTKLLVDCGTGVLSNLQRIVSLKDIQHIVISHIHPDHCFDLIPYRYALNHRSRQNVPPRLYLPPGGKDALLNIVSAFDQSCTFFSDSFAVEEYDPTTRVKVGDLSIEFALTRHYIQGYSLSILGTKRIVYSADSGLCDELAQMAREADLLLCEATRFDSSDDDWGHLGAVEVSTLARKAKVKRLMLTHFWPDYDYSQNIRDAAAAFGQSVEVAKELHTYII